MRGLFNPSSASWLLQSSRYNNCSNWGVRPLIMPTNTESRLKKQYKCIIQESDCVCLSHCDIRRQISEQSTWELQRACIGGRLPTRSYRRLCINASSCSAPLSSHCLPLTLPSQNKGKKGADWRRMTQKTERLWISKLKVIRIVWIGRSCYYRARSTLDLQLQLLYTSPF